MSAYKLVVGPFSPDPVAVVRAADGAVIPMDENNRDYQAYLAWVSAGNTVEPAA